MMCMNRINGRDMIIPIKADATNGWWCERCQCYHKYDVYTKPTKSGKF